MRERRPRPPVDEQRERLFRRMEWVFVYAPPLLALLIALVVGAVLAAIVYIPGTSFLGRWALAALLIIAIPLIGYLVRSWWTGE